MNWDEILEDEEPGDVNWFDAGYDSECVTCGDSILEGDRAGYIGTDTTASCKACCLLG